jgi:1-acyl-sn-glycerol-3-phosphate acyltransferase
MFYNLYSLVVTALAYFFFLIFCKGKVYGKRIIWRNIKRGFILAANHSSYLDWLVLLGLFRIHFHIKIKFLAKEKVYRHPLWSPLSQVYGIRVSDNGHELERSSYKHILISKYIGVFPEGTRSPNGKGIKPKNGILKIALIKRLPIILTALSGFYRAWPRHKLFPRPKKCSIVFCEERSYFKREIDKHDKEKMVQELNDIMETIYNRAEKHLEKINK